VVDFKLAMSFKAVPSTDMVPHTNKHTHTHTHVTLHFTSLVQGPIYCCIHWLFGKRHT